MRNLRYINLFIISILLLLSVSNVSAETKTIKFGIMALGKPSVIYTKWKPFVERLSEKTGYKFEIVVRQKLPRLIKMIGKGEIDFAYINSLVYYKFHKKGILQPVAQMQNIEGKWYSNSVIFARSDSKFKTVVNLKGSLFSYVGKVSTGGYLAPRAFMENNGVDTDGEINEKFTMNLSTSIHNVLLGKSDAAATCGVMYRLLSRKIDTGELQIVGESEIYPENLIAAKSSTPPEIVEIFREAILSMKDDPKSAHVFDSLYSMKVDRFVPFHEESIEMIEKLKSQASI